jgi:hypothetical protein
MTTTSASLADVSFFALHSPPLYDDAPGVLQPLVNAVPDFGFDEHSRLDEDILCLAAEGEGRRYSMSKIRALVKAFPLYMGIALIGAFGMTTVQTVIRDTGFADCLYDHLCAGG